MNYSYNPLHLLNTYGAFGGVTRVRHEVVVKGTAEEEVNPKSQWKEYEFWGTPGAVWRRPPQFAPYHLRLDWLIWFAAMRPGDIPFWFQRFVSKLLGGDKSILKLLRTNPFPNQPPRHIRALLYEYRFTSPAEKRATGAWWKRTLIGSYLTPAEMDFRSRACRW